jgi:hypothetical protein
MDEDGIVWSLSCRIITFQCLIIIRKYIYITSASVMLIFSMLTGFIFIDLTIKAGFNISVSAD